MGGSGFGSGWGLGSGVGAGVGVVFGRNTQVVPLLDEDQLVLPVFPPLEE